MKKSRKGLRVVVELRVDTEASINFLCRIQLMTYILALLKALDCVVMAFHALISESLRKRVKSCHCGTPISYSIDPNELAPDRGVMKENRTRDSVLAKLNSLNQVSDRGPRENLPA